MKVYLINLECSTKRLAIMQKRIDLLGLSFERVSAVDGSTLSMEDLSIVNAPNWRYPYTLSKGEIGCFLSHKKCWTKLLESDEEWALILEDDCVFSSKAHQYLATTDWIPKNCLAVQLNIIHARDSMYSNEMLPIINSNSLISIRESSPCGAYAYLLHREAAKVALDLSKTLDAPVDNFLWGIYMDFPKKIQGWRLVNPIAKVIDDVETTIGQRGKLGGCNFYKIHPVRLFEKIRIVLSRLLLKKVEQKWID